MGTFFDFETPMGTQKYKKIPNARGYKNIPNAHGLKKNMKFFQVKMLTIKTWPLNGFFFDSEQIENIFFEICCWCIYLITRPIKLMKFKAFNVFLDKFSIWTRR